MTKRRFLFVMHYPGYLRYFDSVIRMLSARHLRRPGVRQPGQAGGSIEALADMEGSVEVLGRMPGRGDVWATVAGAIRGTMDYARYLHPNFADTPHLRDRMRAALPPIFGSRPADDLEHRVRAPAHRCARDVNGRFPAAGSSRISIRSRRPDAVLVTPLVTDRSPQVDVIKSAQARHSSYLCVASWDHLTTKGLIRVHPDLVSVWNEQQKAEALAYHGTNPDAIVVTGAQPFDRWFERRPTPRAEFCRKVGLPANQPIVIFVGSTKSISAPDAELQFVRRWSRRCVPIRPCRR